MDFIDIYLLIIILIIFALNLLCTFSIFIDCVLTVYQIIKLFIKPKSFSQHRQMSAQFKKGQIQQISDCQVSLDRQVNLGTRAQRRNLQKSHELKKNKSNKKIQRKQPNNDNMSDLDDLDNNSEGLNRYNNGKSNKCLEQSRDQLINHFQIQSNIQISGNTSRGQQNKGIIILNIEDENQNNNQSNNNAYEQNPQDNQQRLQKQQKKEQKEQKVTDQNYQNTSTQLLSQQPKTIELKPSQALKQIDKQLKKLKNKKTEKARQQKLKLYIQKQELLFNQFDQNKQSKKPSIFKKEKKFIYSKSKRDKYIKQVQKAFQEIIKLNQANEQQKNKYRVKKGQFYLNVCHYEKCEQEVDKIIEDIRPSFNDINYIKSSIIKIKLVLFNGEIRLAQKVIKKVKDLIQKEYKGKNQQQIIEQTISKTQDNQTYLQIVLLDIKCINMKHNGGHELEKRIKAIIKLLIKIRKQKEDNKKKQSSLIQGNKQKQTPQIDQRLMELQCRALEELAQLYYKNKLSSEAQKIMRLAIYNLQKNDKKSAALDSLYLNFIKMQFENAQTQQQKNRLKLEFDYKQKIIFESYSEQYPLYWKKAYLQYVILQKDDNQLYQKLNKMLQKMKQYYNESNEQNNISIMKAQYQVIKLKFQKLKIKILSQKQKQLSSQSRIRLNQLIKQLKQLIKKSEQLILLILKSIQKSINRTEQYDAQGVNSVQIQNDFQKSYTFKMDHKVFIKMALMKLLLQMQELFSQYLQGDQFDKELNIKGLNENQDKRQQHQQMGLFKWIRGLFN